MKGIWAGGLSLALAWNSASAVAGDAPTGVRGIELGKPVAVSSRLGPTTSSGVIPANYVPVPPSLPVPAVRTEPAIEPPPLVLPEAVRSPRTSIPLPRVQHVPTSFASESRVFGQPFVLAAVSAVEPSPGRMPIATTRPAFAPLGEEQSFLGGIRNYASEIQQVLAPLVESVMPASGSDSFLGGETSNPGWPYRFYGKAEYLLWWTKGADLPPLVTTGPESSLGIIGQPGTTILFGNGREDHDLRSGGRFTLGWWWDECQTIGLESSTFFLGRRSAGFAVGSDSTPLIARPFFSLNQGAETAEVAAFPGRVTGTVNVDMPNRLWGTQLNVRKNWCRSCDFNLDLLVGARYLELEEGLTVIEDLRNSVQIGQFAPGTRFLVQDSFDTRNQFYGGQVGAQAEWRRGPWFLDLRGTVALGNTRQTVNINGNQAVTSPAGVTSRFLGGLLALPTNSGRFRRDDFSVVPEVGVNLGYQVGPNLRMFVGYNFLYWSNVLRPGDQIDRVLDETQIPNFGSSAGRAGLGRPIVPFKSTDFWAQGVSFGVELRY